eukprot:snap_masked-scaffold_31-processed-gene-3.56-mRNA-1 protein AED:1.00 eAED:1.00 QI:0/0/0/0/1/1/2/0/62
MPFAEIELTKCSAVKPDWRSVTIVFGKVLSVERRSTKINAATTPLTGFIECFGGMSKSIEKA